MSIAAPLIIATSAQVEVAAGTDEERYMNPPSGGEWEIDSITFTPATAVAKDGSNYHTVTIKRKASGDLIAGWKTEDVAAGIALVLGTAIRPTLDRNYTRCTGGVGGDCLEIAVVNTGTGATLDGEVLVVWRKCQADA
jgi:hypothetical protein